MNQPIHPHLASKSKLTTNQSIYQWRNIFERAIRKNISKIFFHAKTEHTFITEYDNLLRFYNRERLVTASAHRITSNAPVITQRLSGLVLTFLYSDFTYLRDGYQIYMFFFFFKLQKGQLMFFVLPLKVKMRLALRGGWQSIWSRSARMVPPLHITWKVEKKR